MMSNSTTDQQPTSFPVHIFSRDGKKYALDLNSSTVSLIDEKACAALTHLGFCKPDNLFDNGCLPDPDVLAEVEQLVEAGILSKKSPEWFSKEYISKLAKDYVRWPTKGIELMLTSRCNLACSYCYCRTNMFISDQDMSQQTIDDALEFGFQRNANLPRLGISLFGGEPTIAKEQLKYVTEKAHRRGRTEGKRIVYSLTTNGTLIDDELLDLFRDYRIELTISIDGDKALQNRNRPLVNGGDSWDAVCRGIERLQKYPELRIGVRCTLTSESPSQQHIAKTLRDLGVETMHLVPVSSPGYQPESNKELLMRCNSDLDACAESLLDELSKGREPLYNPFADDLAKFSHASTSLLSCGVTRAVQSISNSGYIYPCHRFVGNETFCLGSVKDGLDRDLTYQFLHSYFDLRRQCEACWARKWCNINCPWEWAIDIDRCQFPSQWRCLEYKKDIERIAWLYHQLATRFPTYLSKFSHV